MRRALVVAAVAALVLGGCSDSDSGSKATLSEPEVQASTWTPVPGQVFAEPDQVSQGIDVALTLDATAKTISVSGDDLAATPFAATPAGGQPLTPKLSGPTIHVSPGGTITVTFVNSLDGDTNIHYHGLHVSPLDESDNVFRTFVPGQTYQSVVHLPDNHPSGTYWYHVHFHGDSEIQVNGGLSGLLIVDGIERSLPEGLRGIPQHQFALREVMTMGNTVINQQQRTNGGYTTTRLVNDQLEPILTMKQNDYQLWRFANIGPDVFYYLTLKGHSFMIVAEDGNPVFNGKITSRDELELPPGKRYDVVIQGGQPGTYQLAATSVPGDTKPPPTPVTMASITVLPNAALNALSPADITVNAPDDGLREDREEVVNNSSNGPVVERTFTFGFTSGHFTINGEVFDPDKTNVAVPLGGYEKWILKNTTGGPHPFHIHVNEFQVESINGVPYDAIGVQDIVAIPKKVGNVPGEVVIINHYLDYDGWFVFHCHILNHEDSGMMQTIEVLKPGQLPSPPPHDMNMDGAAHPRISVG